MNNSKFIFFGSPRFAEIVLSNLLEEGFIPSTVICNPDKPTGRKKIITSPKVKTLAEKHNIPVLQPKKLTDEIIRNYAFGVVAAYANIIPKSVIELFPKGIIGIHPSLLPKLRGATPIQSAILKGEKKTGVSLFLIDEKVDHGPIIAKSEIPISDEDTYLTLEEKLGLLGAKLLINKIDDYLSGEITPSPQNDEEATLTKKFIREDAFIEIGEILEAENGKNTEEVSRKIRAFYPEPGAWTIQKGKQIKLLDCRVENEKLILKKIQIEGKKPQSLNSNKSPF